MNQNKEQDFLDSPEFREKLESYNRAYSRYARNDNKRMDRELWDDLQTKEQSLKTFIREKMKPDFEFENFGDTYGAEATGVYYAFGDIHILSFKERLFKFEKAKRYRITITEIK